MTKSTIKNKINNKVKIYKLKVKINVNKMNEMK